MIGIVAVLSSLSLASAHIALWDAGMFGLNYPYQANDPSNFAYNNNQPVNPLRESDGLTESQWFGHGLLGYPPAPGNFMTLPAGGTYNGELNCNRAGTSFRDPSITGPLPQYACDGVGALHVNNQFNQTADPQWFGGTALAIAYTSDETSVQPNDFTVISVNQNEVWYRAVSYSIPAALPACPSGGCLCTWNWIHEANHGEGYPYEIYNVMYRCQVTGATSTGAVMRGAVPVECSANPSTCVSGPKTPMYLYQADGNNMAHVDTPPNYKNNYGFSDGAQNDVFAAAATPAPTTYQFNPYATPSSSVSGRPTPTATTLPSGWISVGCNIDQNSPRALVPGAFTSSSTNMSWSYCVNYCASQNLNYAGVENGNECWCSNSVNLNATNSTDCNTPCDGDLYATCGGSWRIQVFLNVYAPSSTTSASPVPYPTAALPAGWSTLGCGVDGPVYRVLNRGATQFPTNNTVPNCIATCGAQGWPYAGVEYGQECWCGDVANFTAATDNGCNMACTGDPGSDCGGSYRINVYQNNTYSNSVSSSATTTTTSISATSTSSSSSTGTGTTGTGTTGTGATGTGTTGTGATGTAATGTATGTGATGTGTGTAATGTGTTGTGTIGTGTTGTGVTGTGATGTGVTGTGATGTGGTSLTTPSTTSTSSTSSTTSTSTTSTTSTTPSLTSPSTTPPSTTPPSTTSRSTTSTPSSLTSTTSTTPSPTSPSSTTPSPTSPSSTTPSPTSPSSTPKPTSPTTTPTSTPSPTTPTSTPKPTSPSTSPSSTSTTSSTTTKSTSTSTTTTTPKSTSTSSTSTASPTPTGAVVLPTGWKVAGCVADSTATRVLKGASGTSTSLTPSLCASWCASKKYTWAGTEQGNTCYCGTSFSITNTTGCSTPCTGAKTVACGGTLRLSVYNKGVSSRGFEEREMPRLRFDRDLGLAAAVEDVAVANMSLEEFYDEVYSKQDNSGL